MDEYPLQIKNYYFPHQSVTANPNHDANGRKDGNLLKLNVNVTPIEGRIGSFAITVTLSLDEEASENPLYFFDIQAFGIFNQASNLPAEVARQLAALPVEEKQRLAAKTGGNILIGAIRERLADLTCRAPWGIFILDYSPVVFQASPPVGQSTE